MSQIGVRTFPHFEVTYVDVDDNQKREVVPSHPDSLRDFVARRVSENCSIVDMSFYVEIWIERPGENTVNPHQRFGEQNITSEELQVLSDAWFNAAVEAANPQIDEYLRIRFGATPS